MTPPAESNENKPKEPLKELNFNGKYSYKVFLEKERIEYIIIGEENI
jgi:hypothetical protein